MPIQPTKKQLLAYKYLGDDTTKEILYGGAAGGGKSWLGCEWLLQCCHNIPGSRWFIGREELKRIRQSTLITFFKVCKFNGYNLFKFNGQDNCIIFNNGSRIDLLDLRYLPSDPLYERFGSLEYTGGWIEEGGEINFGAYDVLKTRVGRHLNKELNLLPKILTTCNPKKNWMYQEFYKPSREGTLLPTRKFIKAFVTDNPFLDKHYIDNLRSTKDKSKYERLFKGNWEYDDDPARLIDDYDKIIGIFDSNKETVEKGKKCITADIARFGSDKAVIMVWDGWNVIEIVTMDKSRIDVLANTIIALCSKHKIPRNMVVCDEDGVGGGVVDIGNKLNVTI